MISSHEQGLEDHHLERGYRSSMPHETYDRYSRHQEFWSQRKPDFESIPHTHYEHEADIFRYKESKEKISNSESPC